MKIAIIGAGVMGASIAAHIASCDMQVLLLDLADGSSNDKNHLLHKALDRIANSKPALISHPSKLNNIHTYNLQDNIVLLQDCDLVIEAIVEKLDAKLKLFSMIAKFLSKGCVIASNTSTLSLSLLKQQNIWPETIVIHFFNPPRYLSLVELITDSDIPTEKVNKIKNFLTHSLGKNVIRCNDSPGFIANRIGCFFLELALQKAIEKNLSLQKIDYIAHKILLFPKTGIFGLYDLIGLDVMQLIGKSLTSALKPNDQYHNAFDSSGLVFKLIQRGSLGAKTQQGFYKRQGAQRFVLDLSTLEYAELLNLDDKINNNLREFLTSQNEYSRYFKDLIKQTYEYALKMIPAVTDNIARIDEVLKLGFNWHYGISQLFEMFWHNFSAASNGCATEFAQEVLSNQDAAIFDFENSFILRFKTKVNILNAGVFNLMNEAIDLASKRSRKLIIYNQGKHFSAGGDLKFFLQHAKDKNFQAIRNFLQLGQDTFDRIKYCSVPVISIAKNLALGGGCELLLQSNAVVSGIELQAGLIEVGLGLIPAWGGLKEMIMRAKGDKVILQKLLNNILYQNKTSSADFFKHDYLNDIFSCVHPDDMLRYALDLDTSALVPPARYDALKLPEISLLDSKFDEHTAYIATLLEQLVCGAQVTEKELLKAEIEIFMDLIQRDAVITKISKILNIY
jgi:3-hydroxyacyl-CoA dehydrogenase/enoyl-CoA hydratase/carnithine racemase